MNRKAVLQSRHGDIRRGQSFLYNGTRSLFEQAGCTFERSKGRKNTVMIRTVSPSDDRVGQSG